MLRKGLRQVLEADANLKVAVEAGDGEALLSQIEASRPHIAIVDVDMPKQDGFAVAKEITRRKLPVDVVFLTIHNEVAIFHAAMDLGIKGLQGYRAECGPGEQSREVGNRHRRNARPQSELSDDRRPGTQSRKTV
jgi:DNA-binding NarL/FixJ family response regulator